MNHLNYHQLLGIGMNSYELIRITMKYYNYELTKITTSRIIALTKDYLGLLRITTNSNNH